MMLISVFEEEKTGSYTKGNSCESVDFKVIVYFFSFDVFYPEKSGNILVLLLYPNCRKAFSISATMPIFLVLIFFSLS